MVVPASPEEARIRAEGKHEWLAEEDEVLARLEELTARYGPLKAAQMIVDGEGVAA